MAKRNTYTPEYKAKIVIEILEGEQTISEIASREGINVNQLKNWKKEFLENASRAFNGSKSEKEAKRAAENSKKREEKAYAENRSPDSSGGLAQKKNLKKCSDLTGRKSLVMKNDRLNIKEQCELLEINRTSMYYQPVEPAEKALEREEYIKSRIDYWHTKFCYIGHRKIKEKLVQEDGIAIGRKLVRRYMAEMNICPVYPKSNLSKPGKNSLKFPYLLKNLKIDRPNQVWSIDITYIKMGRSHMYLTAIIDWYSGFIVGYELSDTLDTAPVLAAVTNAMEQYGNPEIINSDQGSQFTSNDYIEFLKAKNIRQSMDGKARWVDNVVIERWFRSLKTELIYINEYSNPRELRQQIGSYIKDYNNERPHQALGYKLPVQVYQAKSVCNAA